MRGTNISDLESHLYDVIERLKESDDPDCDPKDKISLDAAGHIIDASKVLVEIQKVKLTAVKMVANYDDPVKYMRQQGIIEDQTIEHHRTGNE